MGKEHEFRVAIGAYGGRRSTVWKFETRKNDAYIGRDAKIALHASGACHLGLTRDWVQRRDGRIEERHFEEWAVTRPTGTEAPLVFEILVPSSELIVVHPEEPRLEKRVCWIPDPGPTLGVVLGCHMTPPVPRKGLSLPNNAICCLPMSDDRHIVVLVSAVTLVPSELVELRRQALLALACEGIVAAPGMRISAHRGGGVPGIVEMAALLESNSPDPRTTDSDPRAT